MSVPSAPSGSAIWAGVDRLLDEDVDISSLRAHKLELLAVRRFRSLGREVPEDLVRFERSSVAVALTAPVVLARARASTSARMVLLKGPEVAAHYPHPLLRPFRDLDLLVRDAEATQRDLIAGGFVEVGPVEKYEGIHHLRPLWLPELPVLIEVHSEPKWPYGIPPPPTEELLAAAVPATIGVAGIGTLPPGYHAPLLAAHAWAHAPLESLGDLVDVVAVASAGDVDQMGRLADRWGLSGVWKTTLAAASSVLVGRRSRPLAVRLWARHLPAVRGRTPLESYLVRFLNGFWALPTDRPLRQLALVGRRRLRGALGGQAA